MASTRRLTAILAADVAGYSCLMGLDEEGTHERLRAHLRGLIDPKIKEHQGRIVKNTGDGMLAEFPSVVDAVRCAAEVQRGMIDREPEASEERRIRFRIGINLGDVIAEGGDIFGDGVNVAARLEALAEPGGICISRVVRDQIRDKLPYPFEDRGEQSVKNIARPVRVYALRPEAVADLPAASILPAASTSQPRAAPRLSIVVLPFANLSDDREQQYFADGITEDLTTADPDALDYILRGRAAWNRPPARDNYAEAISLFERALVLDPRSVEAQSLLARALAGRVRDGMTNSRAADIERAEGLVGQALAISPGNPIAHLAKADTLRAERRCEEAIAEYEIVLALNRNSLSALAGIGICKILTGSVDEAIPLTEQAIRLSPRDSYIVYRYQWIGIAHLLQSHTDEAIVWLEKARRANPGIPGPHAYLASAYALKGDLDRAAAELAEARRLNNDGQYSSITGLSSVADFGVPKIRALFEATYFAGLRKAGMSEE